MTSDNCSFVNHQNNFYFTLDSSSIQTGGNNGNTGGRSSTMWHYHNHHQSTQPPISTTTTTSAEVSSFGASHPHQIVMIPAEVSNGNVHLVESATTQVSGTTAALNSTEAQHQICGNCFFYKD